VPPVTSSSDRESEESTSRGVGGTFDRDDGESDELRRP
jgi:hypothetical protein